MGFFITFEGIEGCGKGTQTGLLGEFLLGLGHKVRLIREPGSTPIGESIRGLLLTSKGDGMGLWTELFLYEACRAELAASVILPAMEAGEILICDRFIDSTLAYQGYGRGLDLETLRGLNTTASLGKVPDLTILLDCPVELGLERAQKRIDGNGGDVRTREDRFEREEIDFHRRVRNGFLELAVLEPARIKVVDGGRAIEEVALSISSIVKERLKIFSNSFVNPRT